MKLATIETWYLWLMIYSIVGWIYESIICSIGNRKLVNRGFLNGPYCPIYGSGAVLILLVLGKISNPVLLFFLGALLTCSLEYFTSYIMEVLFHARWWDYSKRFCNINGRVCLLGAVVFGSFTVVLVKFLHPIVSGLTSRLSPTAMHWVCGILLAGFLSDMFITVKGLIGTHAVFEEYAEILRKRKEEFSEKLRSAPAHVVLQEVYDNLHSRLNSQQRRMIRSFPQFRLSRNNEVLDDLRKAMARAKERAKERVAELKEEARDGLPRSKS